MQLLRFDSEQIGEGEGSKTKRVEGILESFMRIWVGLDIKNGLQKLYMYLVPKKAPRILRSD